MSSTTDVLPGALWATRDTDTTRPTSLARSLFGGFLIEAVLLGSLGAIAAMAQVTPPPPEVIMQVEMPKPEEPPPPPPPKEIIKQKPIVQKTITRKIVMQQPKPITPQPVVEPTPEPVIAATPRPSPAAPAVATPAPAAAHAPSAPVAMTLACPVQTSPEMPAKALAMGIQGRVTARAKIQSGKVISVQILKSDPPGVFDAAVKSAMMRYQCENNSDDIVSADQTFNFALN